MSKSNKETNNTNQFFFLKKQIKLLCIIMFNHFNMYIT
jgi:hypothetical protein